MVFVRMEIYSMEDVNFAIEKRLRPTLSFNFLFFIEGPIIII